MEVPEPIYLEENLSIEDAQIKEDYWRNYYASHGYTMLNKAKTGAGSGSIGSITKWTKKVVIAEAKKCKTRSEFHLKYAAAYMYAKKHNMLDDLFDNLIKYHRHWNDESVKEEAKKYKSKSKFIKGSYGAYKYAKNIIL